MNTAVTSVTDLRAADATSIDPSTIRKLRVTLLPFLFLLYVVAFLDRINIGFAALTMNRELGISSQQFGFLVGVFFFGYFLLEIPSNLLLHKLGARRWIARILLTWGVVAKLHHEPHLRHRKSCVRRTAKLENNSQTHGNELK